MSQLPAYIEEIYLQVIKRFPNKITNPWLLVDSSSQSLLVMSDNSLVSEYSVSTSKYGLGCEQDSFKTPLGAHYIAQKIGGDKQQNEIFVGREASGEIAEISHEKKSSELDLILTRILWLQGLEENRNCGDGIDSFQRYIYIHGTHDEGLLGSPASHGCVRMSNANIMELFERVAEKTFVYIC